jgi:DNA-binding response OmpR family regulator
MTDDRATLLLVEDDPVVRTFLADNLTADGYDVLVAGAGRDALRLLESKFPDAVVLDVGLPDGSGLDVVREVRRADAAVSRINPATPVIVLSGRGEELDRLRGLEAGADDYLPKPFAYPELLARIRALGRRSQAAVPPLLEHGDVRLDPARRVATRAGAPLPLNPKELAVLEYLLAAQGRVVSAEELLERVWDEATDPFTTTVKATMNRLRSKLGEPPIIETVPRAGYRI